MQKTWLFKARQTLWQLIPITSVEREAWDSENGGWNHHLVEGDSAQNKQSPHIPQILQFIHADRCVEDSLLCLRHYQ